MSYFKGQRIVAGDLINLPNGVSIEKLHGGWWVISDLPASNQWLVDEIITADIGSMTSKELADWILERCDRKPGPLPARLRDADGDVWTLDTADNTYYIREDSNDDGKSYSYKDYSREDLEDRFGPMREVTE